MRRRGQGYAKRQREKKSKRRKRKRFVSEGVQLVEGSGNETADPEFVEARFMTIIVTDELCRNSNYQMIVDKFLVDGIDFKTKPSVIAF